MTKIVHFADAHLGITNFGRLDPETGLNSRILDYLETLDCLVDAVNEINPDLILFAGDAFKTREPNVTLVTHFSRTMMDLANVAPVVAILGNHDRQTKGSGKRHSIEVWGDLETQNPLIVSQDIEGITLGDVYIVTLPWFYDKDLGTVCDELDAVLARQPKRTSTVLLGHIGVDGAQMSAGSDYSYEGIGSRDFCAPLDLFATDIWDYAALGHIHLHQCLNDDPPVVYSGSLDRIDWGERHDPGKGFVLVDIKPGNVSWEFIDLDVRPMVDLRIPYGKNMSKRFRGMDLSRAIVKVTVIAQNVSRYKAAMELLDCLPDMYWLEPITVEVAEEPDPIAKIDRTAKSPEAILREYLGSKHPDEEEWVDVLMEAAQELMYGEEM